MEEERVLTTAELVRAVHAVPEAVTAPQLVDALAGTALEVAVRADGA